LPVQTSSWTDFQYCEISYDKKEADQRPRATSAAVRPRDRTIPITIEFTDKSQCAIRAMRLTRLSEAEEEA
jgi:hypothetical protein